MIPSPHVEVVRATREQQPILENLLQLYAHDFSEFQEVELGPDARFGYKPLPLYWTEPGRHPFLVKADDKWAGFVLVKRGSEVSGNANIWDMAEFFVVRGYRRHGLGTQVAHHIWKRFPGEWEVRVMETNVLANLFWVRTISRLTGRTVDPVAFEKDGRSWKLFSFESIASGARDRNRTGTS